MGQLECQAAGPAIKNLLKEDIRPTDIMTRQAFEDAMVLVNITGGSTNAVLHLIAMAHSVGVDLTIDDFQAVSDRTPFLADLKPSGKYVFQDLYDIGGTPSLIKFMLKEGIIDGSRMTVTGRTVKENVEKAADFPSDQEIIRPMSNPIKPTGHIQILRGSLAPEGSVGKITGKEGTVFTGKARCFDAEDDFIAPRGQHLHEGREGRRHHPLRRSEGWTWHARDAQALFGHHGLRTRKRPRSDHRWPLLRRLTRVPDRPCYPRSAGRRTHRPGPRRRHDLHRR